MGEAFFNGIRPKMRFAAGFAWFRLICLPVGRRSTRADVSLLGAPCAAVFGAILAAGLKSRAAYELSAPAPSVPDCLSFGKGGSLCPRRPAEQRRNDECANFGKAGRLCFSDQVARPRNWL